MRQVHAGGEANGHDRGACGHPPPARGIVGTVKALLIGAVAGVLCQDAVNPIRNIWKIDDTLGLDVRGARADDKHSAFLMTL